MADDLRTQISRMTQADLDLWKRQFQERTKSFSPAGVEALYSRLRGIPELADFVPTEIRKEAPLWQKPLEWLGDIGRGFGTVVAAPFTPAVPGTEQLPWFQRERAEYEAWEEPSFPFTPPFRLPWTPEEVRQKPWTIGVKGALEFLPWLALPTGAGIAAKLGVLGARAGIVGRVARAALPTAKAAAKVERIISYPITNRYLFYYVF